MRKVFGGAIAMAVVALAMVPSHAAADVTIGSNLAGPANANICSAGFTCTYIQTSGGTPIAASPIDGRVVRWRVKTGSATGSARLRVLRPAGGSYTAIASSVTEPIDSFLETYTTDLPIKAGDVIALDNASSGLLFTNAPAVTLPLVLYFQPGLADGAAGTPNNLRTGLELLLNADVAPLPANPQPGQTPTPAISKLKLKPSTFKAAKSGASVAKRKRLPVGTTVSYTLSTDATVTFTAERARKGRRSGGACKKAGRRAKGKRCTRYVTVPGSFDVAGRGGANQFKFSGRIANQKLRPGKYRLLAKPSASGKTGTPASKKFRIKKR
jgi:hypothetical protein